MPLHRENLTDLLKPLFIDRLEPIGIEDVTFSEEIDYDGEATIYADIKYKLNADKLFNASLFLDTIIYAMSKLEAKGDHRFIYTRHHYQDGEPALNDFWLKPKAKRRSAK